MADFKFIMFFLSLAAALLAGWSVEVARMFARRIAKERQRLAHLNPNAINSPQSPNPPAKTPWPPAAVILPLKGLDHDTPENLRALFAQDYPHFRLLFAVESADDPVLPLLDHLAQTPAPNAAKTPAIEIIIAGLATSRGQKIHNQLAALAHTTAADEILVFMDADAHPAPHWLRELIDPLVQNPPEGDLGATTGFRFYIPASPGKNLPDAMLSIINAAVAALLGPGWRNMAWGGSMALRREHFFSFGIHDAWQNALSDDYVLSYCIKTKAKRRIQFVQGCLVESAADASWPAFWEFAARQYKITRICAPFVWLAALGAAFLYLVTLAYTLVFWIASLFTAHPDHPLLLLFLAIYLANVIRGYFLLQGGIAAFPAASPKLRAISFWYTWAYPLALLINLLALLKAAAGRTITWRGVRYHMTSLLQTRVERSPRPHPPALPQKLPHTHPGV